MRVPGHAQWIEDGLCWCGRRWQRRLDLPRGETPPPIPEAEGALGGLRAGLNALIEATARLAEIVEGVAEVTSVVGEIDTLVANAWRKETGQSYTLIAHMGGAIRRVPEGETAFAGRDSDFAVNINAAWTDPAAGPRDVEWARSFWAALERHSTGGVYVNFLGEEGASRVRAAYGSKWSRLARLKARYDPENVFRLNQNIAPDSRPG